MAKGKAHRARPGIPGNTLKSRGRKRVGEVAPSPKGRPPAQYQSPSKAAQLWLQNSGQARDNGRKAFFYHPTHGASLGRSATSGLRESPNFGDSDPKAPGAKVARLASSASPARVALPNR